MSNPKSSETQKRSSLIKRLLIMVGAFIIAINAIQLLFVTTQAKSDIIAENINMYMNMRHVGICMCISIYKHIHTYTYVISMCTR